MIANGKGAQSQANSAQWKQGAEDSRNPGYVGAILQGTLSLAAIPDERQLREYSAQVRRNSPLVTEEPGAKPPFALGRRSPIRYVFYIIKENRTYDSVFGDMREGNGDPGLLSLSRNRSRRIITRWRANSCCSTTSTTTRKSVPTVIIGSPALTPLITWRSSGPACMPAAAERSGSISHDDPMAFSGRRISSGTCAPAPASPIEVTASSPACGAPNRAGARRQPQPRRATSTPRISAPMAYPAMSDCNRLEIWLTEFREFEKTRRHAALSGALPPRRSHRGARDRARRHRRAMMAENDLALGRIVEAMSHSRFWKETAIFVVEDDAQNGPDHVDCHRTVALLISPYTRRGAWTAPCTRRSSMLRTMELLLGCRR